ncbi:MAG: aldo/keto reductase, partial [Litorivicinus sp.]
LIHRPDPFMDPADTGRALDDLIDAGKIKAAGVSNFKPWDLDLLQAHMRHPLVTNQIEISPLATDAFVNGDIAKAQTLGIKPMAWSPLAGGALFGASDRATALRAVMQPIADSANVSLDAVAIAWLLAHPAGILPVMGTNNLERIGTLSSAMDVSIDRQQWFAIYEAATGQEVP